MASFVHLTGEKALLKIKRTGITPSEIHYPDMNAGVFAMPVIDDYFATHQWVRELMRFGLKNVRAVYFRISDDDEVWYGYFNAEMVKGTAAEAVNAFMSAVDKMGFQVIIPRKISARDIYRIKKPQAMGWRYFPDAKGRKPCLCPACITKGEYGVKKMLNNQVEALYTRYQRATSNTEKTDYLMDLTALIADHKVKFQQWQSLLDQNITKHPPLFQAAAQLILTLNNSEAMEALLTCAEAADENMQYWLALEILYYKGRSAMYLLEGFPMLAVERALEEYNSYMED